MRAETPPPSRRAALLAAEEKWRKDAGEMRANPGRWYLVAEDANRTVAHNIRRGQLRAFRPAGAFEVETATIDGKRHLYVRFVG